MLYSLEGGDILEETEESFLVYFQIGTGLGVETVSFVTTANPAFCSIEISGGSTKITDGAAKVFLFCNELAFIDNGSVAAAHRFSPLMPGDGTEGAVARTTADNGYRVLDHLQGRDIGLTLVGGTQEGQGVYRIELFLIQRLGRRVLYQPLGLLLLQHRLPGLGPGMVVHGYLGIEEESLLLFYLGKRWQEEKLPVGGPSTCKGR